MIRYINELNLEGKRVFLRLDLNVPLDTKTGEILDSRRIDEALPSIRYCLKNSARLILCSHLGRPKGKVVPELSLEPVAKYLSEQLSMDVMLLAGEINDGVHQISKYKGSSVLILLENIRFFPEEEANNKKFAFRLASLADVYINDAFGTCHRKHASIYGVVPFFSEVGAGFLVRKELKFLTSLASAPKQPFVMLLGGAKVTDKLSIIDNLINHVDKLIIGGAMSYVFLKEKGFSIGKSKFEEAGVEVAKSILRRVEKKNMELYLPEDHKVIYPDKDPDGKEFATIDSINIPEDAMALDIGPKTIKKFSRALADAKTLFWNGPLGLCEKAPFFEGTKAIAEFAKNIDAIKVVGGGDTVSSIRNLEKEDNFDLLSTGGGASLKFLQGKDFPGIDILERKTSKKEVFPFIIEDEDEDEDEDIRD